MNVRADRKNTRVSWSHPVFILTHDRLVSVENLVEWLERAGCERVVFVDSGSTYEPLRDWLTASPHEVHWLPNENRDAFWNHGLVPQEEPFAFCAPDVLPTEDCPLDAFEYLWELLQGHPVTKAGCGLVHDDLEVVDEERMGFAGKIGRETVGELLLLENTNPLDVGLCQSLIDHHFCVYRPGTAPVGDLNAIRTKAPSLYMVRHVPWYEDHPLTPDVTYYVKHAIRGGNFSSWLTGENAKLVDT